MMRRMLLAMSKSSQMQRWTMKSRLTRKTVDRFIAGNTLDDAAQTAKRLNSEGLKLTMDHLGESVSHSEAADSAAFEYRRLLKRIQADGLDSTISIKPSQLGLALDTDVCADRFRRVVELASALGIMVEIDMEDSPFTDVTLSLYEKMFAIYPNLRVCLQAYLYRCEEDMVRLIELGGSVRLVKGAYREPGQVAWQKKSDVDDNFAHIIDLGLSEEAVSKGFYLAIASHDETLIEYGRATAQENGIPKDKFEYQFLYGIKNDLQKELISEGYTMRLYLPYGMEWYPYFMRRLAERPANLMFLLKNL